MSEAQTTSAAPGPEAGDAEEPRRAAVRRLVFGRLDEAGMVRQAKQSAPDHAAMRQRLVQQLDYLPDAALVTLADTLIRMGEGVRKNQWPAEATIRNFGHRLMPPPVDQAPIITSWLASIEGPLAREGGFLTELYRRLRRMPVPPSRVLDYPRLQDEGRENTRLRLRIAEAIGDGTARQSERDWLRAYEADEARALQIVAEGDARRAAKGEAA